MPSSLERVISRTLVYSTNLPVAVYGTDGYLSRERSFSWQCGINIFESVDSPIQRLTLTTERIFLSCLATRSDKHFQSLACISSCVPPLLITINNRFRNINLMSIGYAPHADEPAVGNLRFSVHWILTNVFATYADILTSASSTSPFDLASTYNRTLPYPYNKLYDAVSVICLAPVYFRRGVT